MIEADDWCDLIYIGESNDRLIYGKSYSTHDSLSRDGFILVEYETRDNAKWCDPNDFITIQEYRNLKINKLLRDVD